MRTAELELGHLAHPDVGTHAGVVLIHDVWGLSDHTRDLAQRAAAEGFCVLAVNLYRGLGPVAIEDPGRWMRALPDAQLLAEVQAAVDALAAHPAVRGGIGVTGFCMGGSYALLAACTVRGLSAAVSFYGLLSYDHGILSPGPGQRPDRRTKPRSPLEAIGDLLCPLLGLFGEQDEFVPVDDVLELERRLAAGRQVHEIVRYPGAGHAFMNDTRPAAYRPEVARDAWGRMLAFFRAHL